MTSKCKKSQIWPFRPWKMTFRAIQPNLSFDMWFMSPKRSFMPKKKKSYWSVSEIDPSPPQSWRTDRRTDRQTDRRTTDKSVLEKLRCLSAGGAKKCILMYNQGNMRFHVDLFIKYVSNNVYSDNNHGQPQSILNIFLTFFSTVAYTLWQPFVAYFRSDIDIIVFFTSSGAQRWAEREMGNTKKITATLITVIGKIILIISITKIIILNTL